MSCKYRVYCAVYGCLNSYLSHARKEITFFRLPTEPTRLSEWLRLMCRDDISNKPNARSYRICDKHFKEQDILPTKTRKILKKNAVPSLNLPVIPTTVRNGSRKKDTQTQTEKLVSDSQVQTNRSLSYNTPRERKLKNELSLCRKKLRLCETQNSTLKTEKSTFHKLCDKFLSKELALLVKAQTNLKIHGKGNRYSMDYLIFCLSFFFTSPQAYRFLQSTLCLPCTTTLYKHSFPITTEINDGTMSILKTKVKAMTEEEKICSVMIDAMSLKAHLFYDIKADKIIGLQEVEGWQSPEPAKYALVIMIRGIFIKWKQPIAYALLSECRNDEITKWIDKVLEMLFEIGLNIRTLVSDQRSDFWEVAKQRSVSIDKPYFYINNRKIYYIFDVPHLIKNLRNNFMQYNFHFENSIAKFEHVVQFFEQDIKKSCRLAHKLTNSHIKPTNFEKNKVSYATQLLSNSVAEGISTYIDNNYIDVSGRDTVKFIKNINNMFDSLNSSKRENTFEYKKAYTGNESQNKFFREMLCFFQDLKLINPKTGRNCTSNVRFIEGFQMTIKSLLLLFDDLRLEGYSFILTRRFNKDPLEKFFGQIRAKNGSSMNLTPRQFLSAFKKLYFSNIIKPPKGRKCADDLGNLLVQITDSKGINSCAITELIDETICDTHNEESDLNIKITSSEYNQLDMPEKNSLLYICGYLLKRCGEKHNDCLALKSYIKPNQRSHNFSAESRYFRYRDYSKNNLNTCLIVPPIDFVQYVEKMEIIFRTSFKRQNINIKVSASLYEKIKDIPFSPPCACFPKKFLIMLFIRMRVFYTLKFNNKAFRSSRARRKYFSVANL